MPSTTAGVPSSSEQVIESRERLDTVSPLPPLPSTRPPSAALLKSGAASPSTTAEDRGEFAARESPAAAQPEPWWLHPLIVVRP